MFFYKLGNVWLLFIDFVNRHCILWILPCWYRSNIEFRKSIMVSSIEWKLGIEPALMVTINSTVLGSNIEKVRLLCLYFFTSVFFCFFNFILYRDHGYRNNGSLTCDMVHWIKSNSKTTDFQRIILLVASHKVLNSFPIVFLEDGVIVTIESWALEFGELWIF